MLLSKQDCFAAETPYRGPGGCIGLFQADFAGVPGFWPDGMGLAKEWAEQQHNFSPLPTP